MALRIRLRRVGRRNQPSYRIVVADSRASTAGNIVAELGHYHPRAKGAQVDVDLEKARGWLKKGATTSETVTAILKKAGCFTAPAPKEA